MEEKGNIPDLEVLDVCPEEESDIDQPNDIDVDNGFEEDRLPSFSDIFDGVENTEDKLARKEKKNEEQEPDLPKLFEDLSTQAKDEFEEEQICKIDDLQKLRMLVREKELDAQKKMSSAPATRDQVYQIEFDKILDEVETLERKIDALQNQLDSQNEGINKLKEMNEEIKRHEYISKFLQKSRIIFENPHRLKLQPPPDDIKTCFNIKDDKNKQSNGQTATIMLRKGGEELFQNQVHIDELRDLGKKPEYHKEIKLPQIGLNNAEKDHVHCEEFLLKNKKLQGIILSHQQSEGLQLFLFTKLSPCTDRIPRHPKQAKSCLTIISEKVKEINVKTSVCFCMYYADGFDLFQKDYDRWLSSLLGRYDKQDEFEKQRLFWTDECRKNVLKIVMYHLPHVTSEVLYLSINRLKVDLSNIEEKWILESWKNALDDNCVNEKSITKVFPELKDNIAKLNKCCKLFEVFALQDIGHFIKDMCELDPNRYSTLKSLSSDSEDIIKLEKQLKSDSMMTDLQFNKKIISFTLEIHRRVSKKMELSVNLAELWYTKVQENIADVKGRQPLSIYSLWIEICNEGEILIHPQTIRKLQDILVLLIRLKINGIADEQLTLHMIEDIKKNMGSPQEQRLLKFYKYD